MDAQAPGGSPSPPEGESRKSPPGLQLYQLSTITYSTYGNSICER